MKTYTSRAYNIGFDSGVKWVMDGGDAIVALDGPSPAATLIGFLSRKAWRDALGLAEDERDNPASDAFDPWRPLDSAEEVTALTEYNLGWRAGANAL